MRDRQRVEEALTAAKGRETALTMPLVEERLVHIKTGCELAEVRERMHACMTVRLESVRKRAPATPAASEGGGGAAEVGGQPTGLFPA